MSWLNLGAPILRNQWCRAIGKTEVAGRNASMLPRGSRRWKYWVRQFYHWAAIAHRFADRMGEPISTVSRNGVITYEGWFHIKLPQRGV
jgi:hypothetical protein